MDGLACPVSIRLMSHWAMPVLKPATPTRVDHNFVHWHSDAALTTVWNFDTNTITDMTTLYASWALYTPVPTPPSYIPSAEPPDEEVIMEEVEEYPSEDIPSEDTPTEDNPSEYPPSEDVGTPSDGTLDIPTSEILHNETRETAELYNENSVASETTSTDNAEPTIQTNVAEFSINADNNTTSPSEVSSDEADEPTFHPIITLTLTNFGNPINNSIADYSIISRQAQGLKFISGDIPAFTRGSGLFYTISYRTNLNDSNRVLESHIPASRPFTLFPPALGSGEMIIEISIAFDTIPAGFGLNDTITYNFAVVDEQNAAAYWQVMFGEATHRNYIAAAILNTIDNVSAAQHIYSTESWNNLQTIIYSVHAVLDNPNATQEDIEAAFMLLQQGINELTPIAEVITTANIISAATILAICTASVFMLIKLLKYKKRLVQVE